MRDSEQNSPLIAILLTGFVFVVVWFGFSYGLAMSMLFWGHFFQPRWYENLIVIGGGAFSAWLCLREIGRWITSR